MKRYIVLLLAAAVGASCSDTTDPDDSKPEAQLTFLRFDSPDAITTRTGSFWAVKGRDRELEIRYSDGEDFLEFRVSSVSLLRAPDGRTYQDGDSVLITVTVDPTNRIIVYFEPSGLIFNPTEPARLEMNYLKADDDIDHDGDHDGDDESLEARLQIWKQEQPGQPWVPQNSFRIGGDEIEARIYSFTGFAMASS
jgi:hypothetical protein